MANGMADSWAGGPDERERSLFDLLRLRDTTTIPDSTPESRVRRCGAAAVAVSVDYCFCVCQSAD